jgi:hypothetical protein
MDDSSTVPAVCASAMNAELASARPKFAVESSKTSPTLPHCRELGKIVQSTPVISGSVANALRSIR